MENVATNKIVNKTKTDNPKMPARLEPFFRRWFFHEMFKSLPAPVQNRVTMLKNQQIDHQRLQLEFHCDVFNLAKKYNQKFESLYELRRRIIAGEYEPPKEEPKWKSEFEEVLQQEGISEAQDMPDFNEFLKGFKDLPADAKGVPDFWLSIFRHNDTLSQLVYDQDLDALKALSDMKLRYNDDYSFTIEFYFDKNRFFSNAMLTKQYFLNKSIDQEYPFGFECLEIYKCQGCQIKWEKGMDLTKKTLRKRERHRETGAMRTTFKQVERDSFFHFFSPPESEATKLEDMNENVRDILQLDFEIGAFLRDEIIPKAVLYYTGEIVSDDGDDDDDEDDADYDVENDEDEGDDENQTLDINDVTDHLNKSMRN